MNNHHDIYVEACTAGHAAGAACTPKPMHVRYRDRAGNETIETVDDGPCGFAWVNIPGTSSFARWARKEDLARKDYPSGLSFWISSHDQSLTRKAAHAEAFAEVLRKHGVDAKARSRMD